ncbi:hypothetical protein LCGC14_2515040, partial [marine sediment metagenome]
TGDMEKQVLHKSAYMGLGTKFLFAGFLEGVPEFLAGFYARVTDLSDVAVNTTENCGSLVFCPDDYVHDGD